MKYAMLIRKSDLPILAILNGGLEPKVEKNKTYLIIDTDPENHNEIMTEREFLSSPYYISGWTPLLLKLTKTKPR